MKVLITGAAGFIGRNLGAFLREHPDLYETAGVDFAPTIVAFDNCDRQYQADLARANWWTRIFEACPPDVIVHLAAMPGIEECRRRPGLALRSNVGTLTTLLTGAFAAEWRGRVVFASSAAVGSGSLYGAAKAACEELLPPFEAYGIESVVLRFANVYGPESAGKGTAIARFCQAGVRGEPLEVHGDGTQLRDFVYVCDVCQAIRQAFRAEPGTYYVGSGQLTSVDDVARRVQAYFPDAPIRYEPGAGDTRSAGFSDLPRLPMEAHTPLWKGIAKTVGWFKGHCRRPEYAI